MTRTFNRFTNAGSDANLIKALETESSVGPYTKAVCSAVLSSNDMKHLHLHIKDKTFDRIHGITNDYYDELSEDCDYLSELAMEHDENCPNFTLANRIVPEWIPISADSFVYDTAIRAIGVTLSTYIAQLEVLRELTEETDVQSWLDDRLRFWKKEVDFKIKQRVAE